MVESLEEVIRALQIDTLGILSVILVSETKRQVFVASECEKLVSSNEIKKTASSPVTLSDYNVHHFMVSGLT